MAAAVGERGAWTPAPLAFLGDERLARLAAGGHPRAFAVVYERHHQALYRYCRSILRHDADAQDALQSTFAAAFAALARGERDAPIRPWLFRIAHNEAVSILRRRRPTSDLTEAVESSSSSVEEQVAERAEISVLLADLHQLSPRQRSALVMREMSGLSHEEIATALGTSVGAAKQTIYEARQTLFEFAEGRAMACDEIRRTASDADGRALRSRRVRAHLRECSGCALFAESIAVRSAQLEALAPVLPGAAAAGLLERILATGSGHGAGAVGVAGATAGKIAAAGLAANTLAGMAVVASATVGVTIGVDRFVHEAARTGTVRTGAPTATAKPSLMSPSLALPGAAQHLRAPVASGQALRPGAPGAAKSPAGTRGPTSAGVARPSSGSTSATGLGSGPSRHGHGNHHGAGGSSPGASGSTGPGTSATWHPGSGPPPWAGSGNGRPAGTGNSASAGSGKPAWAGSGKPAAAGSGKPTWAGSSGSAAGASAHPGTTGSGASSSTAPGRSASAGPPPWAVSVPAASPSSAVSSASTVADASTPGAAAATPAGGPAATPAGQAKHKS